MYPSRLRVGLQPLPQPLPGKIDPNILTFIIRLVSPVDNLLISLHTKSHDQDIPRSVSAHPDVHTTLHLFYS